MSRMGKAPSDQLARVLLRRQLHVQFDLTSGGHANSLPLSGTLTPLMKSIGGDVYEQVLVRRKKDSAIRKGASHVNQPWRGLVRSYPELQARNHSAGSLIRQMNSQETGFWREAQIESGFRMVGRNARFRRLGGSGSCTEKGISRLGIVCVNGVSSPPG